jgi:aminopeptidase N
MFECYENMLGPYPFPKDGFALVETPYLGMEHQGAIAYGNNYLKGYSGFDYSFQGLDFDYIIIHETGHEYWGNSVSMKDIADMWIHEGFCTYSEALYVECIHGKEVALNYCNSWKYRVANDKPIIGDYDVNSEGSVDMYYKGALMLHTLRWVVNNDTLWFNTIKGIQKDFRFKTTSTKEIVQYMNHKLGNDYTWLFDQYLRSADVPVLEIKLMQNGSHVELHYRWKIANMEFKLPISVQVKDELILIFPAQEWQSIKINNSSIQDIAIDESHAYFSLSKMK